MRCIVSISVVSYFPTDDDLTKQDVHVLGACLDNLQVLADVENNLPPLLVSQKDAVSELICSHLDLIYYSMILMFEIISQSTSIHTT